MFLAVIRRFPLLRVVNFWPGDDFLGGSSAETSIFPYNFLERQCCRDPYLSIRISRRAYLGQTKTSSSPRAQSQIVPAGTSHPRFSWHANTQLPRERDKSSRAASSKTAEQNCRQHCRQNRRRPAPCRPPGPSFGPRGVCPIARGIAPYFLALGPHHARAELT